MKIVTRQEALARGLRKYHTGEKCGRGHVAERYTVSSACAECLAENTNKVRAAFRKRLARA